MGKLGKKARKFAKKNLQSVMKRKRKVNSMIKKKHSSRGKGDATEDQVEAATVPSTRRNSEDIAIGDTSLDTIFSEDDSESMGESSDSDGYLSEDPSCAYNAETECENEADFSGGNLLGQNEEIHLELAKQKRKLDRLREKDPEFSKFLEEQNLVQFDETHYSDGEGEISEEDMDDPKEDESMSPKDKFPTESAIEFWKEQIIEQQNFTAFPNLLNAYRIACHYGSEDVSDAMPWQRIDNSGAFCKIAMFVLQESDGIFRKLLGIASSNCKVETVLGMKNSAKWKKVNPMIKSYLKSTLFLLNQVTDCEILVFSLTQLGVSVVLFAAFPSLLRRLAKVAVQLWATGRGSVSSSAFPIVQKIARINSNCLDTCLVKAYKAFVTHCTVVDSGNLRHLQFLVDSLVELYSLDVSKSFDKAKASIQQLANILRQGIKTKKKEVLKKIYNWQYINCIDLWVKFISANIKDHDLQPFLYTIVQVINGVVHLFPGPRYLPLRLKSIQMLNQLSSSGGVFIPITSLVLDSLEYIGNNKLDEKLGKDFDVSAVLKVPKQWLKLKYFQEELVLSVIELLSVHFSQWSFHISFPDLATFPLMRLRKFHEKVAAENLRRPVKRLIDQVQQNIEFLQKKRDDAAFSPKDLESIESFVQIKTSSGNLPFVKYYASVVRKSLPQDVSQKKSTPEQNVPLKQQKEVHDKSPIVVVDDKVKKASSIDGRKRKKQRT